MKVGIVGNMTSKEYIKAKLEYLIRYEPSLSFDIDMFEQVLKDLERLEVLEKENKELKRLNYNLNEKHYEVLNSWYNELQENEKLKNENQELWENIAKYNHTFASVERKKADLIQENEKLKQQVEDLENNEETVLITLESATNQIEKLKMAIEILKENPLCIVDVIRFNNYFTYREMYDGVVELTKGDFDLLKELLGNET